jgi:uncharacterized coiled-coil DUF342 family protein
MSDAVVTEKFCDERHKEVADLKAEVAKKADEKLITEKFKTSNRLTTAVLLILIGKLFVEFFK